MELYWLTLGVLAVWRVTHLLQAEDGPGDVLVRLRRAAGTGFWGDLLDCFYCLSLWVSAPFALWIGDTVMEWIVLWPALSGGAILLQRVTARDSGPAPAPYFEDEKEDDHGMLRGE